MKGVVFTEFLQFVEASYSPEMVDKMIEESNLPTKGAYTAVGVYDHQEMVKLVQTLSKETNIPVPALIKAFGKHLFTRFTVGYPQFFKTKTNTFEFLKSVENYIHVEVKKLYPDAELPHFKCAEPTPNTLVMTYTSSRSFPDLAEGLIEGCIEYHKENIVVQRQDISVEVGSKTIFTLIKK